MTSEPLGLAEGIRVAGISDTELWMRYLAIGGSGTLEQVLAHVASADCPDEHEHNVIAQALNDTFLEQGHDHPVGYRHLYSPEP
jgi:hypothetical protein